MGDFQQDYLDAQKLANEGKYEDAAALVRPIVDAKPNEVGLRSFLADVLIPIQKFDEIIHVLKPLLAIRPDDISARALMAVSCDQVGRTAEARFHYDHCLYIAPHYVIVQWHRAVHLLKHCGDNLADWFQGWEDYKAEYTGAAYVGVKDKGSVSVRTTQPIWNGLPIPGKTLYVIHEQGNGDSIMMARFFRHIKGISHAKHVILECPQGLMRLYQGIEGIDDLVVMPAHAAMNGTFDEWTSMMMLPLAFRASPGMCAKLAETPYIASDRPVSSTMKKIGVAWCGNPAHPADKDRSIPWETFKPIVDEAKLKGWQIVNLHLNYGAEQVPDPITGDFLETARRIAECDLVICCDTAVAHLAGAMGKPVWIMIAAANDWRWQTQKDTTFWYPAAKLFRQETQGDWHDPVVRVMNSIKCPPIMPYVDDPKKTPESLGLTNWSYETKFGALTADAEYARIRNVVNGYAIVKEEAACPT